MVARFLIPHRGHGGRSLLFGEPFRAIDRIFEDWMRNAGFDTESGVIEGIDYVPYLDVIDNEREIRVEAELPGLTEKDIDVSLQNDVLSLKGEKKIEKEKKEKNYYRSERSYGSFRRDIQLPAEVVDTDKIDASFKNGVLIIKLPKREVKEEKVKKIEIKAE